MVATLTRLSRDFFALLERKRKTNKQSKTTKNVHEMCWQPRNGQKVAVKLKSGNPVRNLKTERWPPQVTRFCLFPVFFKSIAQVMVVIFNRIPFIVSTIPLAQTCLTKTGTVQVRKTSFQVVFSYLQLCFSIIFNTHNLHIKPLRENSDSSVLLFA